MLLTELDELQTSLDCPPSSIPLDSTFKTLRDALEVRGERCAQECRRLVLVFSDAYESKGGTLGIEALRGLCGNIGETAALFVAVNQVLVEIVRRGIGGTLLPGALFLTDLKEMSSAFLRLLSEFVVSVGDCTTGSGEGMSVTCVSRLLPIVGRVQQWSEEWLRKVPKTPGASIKRRLLSAAITLKRSAKDVREETAAALRAATLHESPEMTAAQQLLASQQPPLSSSLDAIPPSFPGLLSASVTVSASVALFKAAHGLVACAGAVADLLPHPTLDDPSYNSKSDVEEEGDGGNPVQVDTPPPVNLDTLASSVVPVEACAIDLAAAVSDAHTSLAGLKNLCMGDEFDESEESEKELEDEDWDGDEEDELSVDDAISSIKSALAPFLLSLETLADRVGEFLRVLHEGGYGVDTVSNLQKLAEWRETVRVRGKELEITLGEAEY